MITAGQLRRAGVYVPPHVPDHETVDAIHFAAGAVVVRPASNVAPSPLVLTRGEAKTFVRRPSEGAFVAWCKRWRVKPGSRGRWSRAALELALERESGIAHTPATLRRHQESLRAGRAAA